MLLDPNIVFLLFVVAVLGVYVEIAHPGTFVPGIVGTIAFVAFIFAASFLAPDWIGLAFMLLAAVLLVLDVKLPGHGALTVGAMLSLVVGALLFFHNGGPGSTLSPILVYCVTAIVGGVGFLLVRIAMRARRMRVTTGVESMIGVTVTAKTPLLPEGRVRYAGEDWAAILDEPAASADPGSKLQIVSVEGLRLHVQPVGSVLRNDVQPIQEML
jgi:membrane-bound serine protease (ClpP class)